MHKVELSEPKVLKQPENGGTSAVGSILKGLGVKSDPKYPTPEEFVRASHGLDEQGRSPSSFVSAASLGLGSNSAPQGMPTSGVSLLQVSFEMMISQPKQIDLFSVKSSYYFEIR